MNIVKLYIDESGFTGNNLLDEDQKLFSLAAVNLDNEESEDIIKKTRTEFELQSTELKAKNMLKTTKGRKACFSIIDSVKGKARVIISDKRYNLCCKFFEYLFEPIISDNSEIFYKSNFHKYIANSLYFMQDNQEFLNRIQHLLRNYNSELKLSCLYKFKSDNQFLDKILTIVEHSEKAIISELQDIISHSGYSNGNLLDLTGTAIYCLCCDFSKRSQQVKIVCDKSKAIDSFKSTLDIFLKSNAEKSITLPNLEISNIIPNLSASIETVDSKTNYSIQLADILAGTVNYCYSNINNPVNLGFIRNLFNRGVLSGNTMMPEEEFIDTKLFKHDYDRALEKMHKNAINELHICDNDMLLELETVYSLYAAAKYLNYC